MLTTEGGSERTWARYLMRMVILHMGINKAEMLNVIFVFKADGLWDHRCSVWRSVNVVTINSRKTVDLCCSTWMHISPWYPSSQGTQKVGHIITRSLSIFQCFWESGEVPVIWKMANVVSIIKKAKKDPGNYRSVSCTWFLVKLWRK